MGFILIGVLAVGVGWYVKEYNWLGPVSDFFSEALKDIGVLISGLAVVDIVWRIVGGDPMAKEMQALQELNGSP